MHLDYQRLFALDESLRAEADQVLAQSGIGALLQAAGYRAVGSYVMGTMTWRDLDFERHEEPDWRGHWEVGTRLAETGWCVRLQCTDVYREAWVGREPGFGLYWGVRVADPQCGEPARPGDPTVWKLDLWTARPEEFRAHPAWPRRQMWQSLLTDESRSHILAIKEAACSQPEYRKTLLSVHIYEAVLEQGVRGAEGFWEWWRTRYGDAGS